MQKRPKIFSTSNSGFKAARCKPGELADINSRGYRVGSTKEITNDGDTISVFAAGNFNVRFLGIDTPEKSFSFVGQRSFLSLNDKKWAAYLETLVDDWDDMESTLGPELTVYIKQKLGLGNVALNHYVHAQRATNKLIEIIRGDMDRLGLTDETMRYFLPFAHETLDGYQRLLGYIHTDRKNPYITGQVTDREKTSYNERMLNSGYSLPYFIWPNINPFRKEKSITLAAYSSPDELRTKLNEDISFSASRQVVKEARQSKIGVFEETVMEGEADVSALNIEAFELRYLAEQRAPRRCLIDLSADDNIILKPTNYYSVLPEDRLFIPEHFVPLLVSKGWQEQS